MLPDCKTNGLFLIFVLETTRQVSGSSRLASFSNPKCPRLTRTTSVSVSVRGRATTEQVIMSFPSPTFSLLLQQLDPSCRRLKESARHSSFIYSPCYRLCFVPFPFPPFHLVSAGWRTRAANGASDHRPHDRLSPHAHGCFSSCLVLSARQRRRQSTAYSDATQRNAAARRKGAPQ
ncbi:hypothetical protein BC567DRAFT_75602 [Phyllosticta citribraziliensis]